MIFDLLLSVGVLIVGFVNWVLGFFSLPYISNMVDAINWAFGLIWMFNGLFPVQTLVQCMFVIMLVYFFRFQIRLFFETIFPLIPFIGKRIHLPRPIGHDDMTQPYYQSVRENPDKAGTYYLYKRRKTKR